MHFYYSPAQRTENRQAITIVSEIFMKKIIECVPNFSEGKNQQIIEAIADSIRNTPGCTLLDVDAGKSTNRTVYTFVADPQAVVEGALNSARVARKLIDMRQHHGEHPRMGAMDVCPFVPVANVSMEECVACAKQFAGRASQELGIPLYLYEAAASQEHRRKLSQIREGEYEGLPKKIKLPAWQPDFGPVTFLPEWGATVTGARCFLVAFNVNILGTKQQAHRIALNIRETGRAPSQPGTLKFAKAIGWWVEEYNMAQVSMNLENYEITPPHLAFEECVKEAKKLNVGVAGSEIVGLIPLKSLLLTADYYIQKENLFILDEQQKIRLAVERLGLNSVQKFEPHKRIIDYMLKEEKLEPLADMSVRKFIASVADRTPSPGGGSASALIAATGAALGTMVAWLTYGFRKFEHLDSTMRELIPPLYYATNKLVPMIDADTNAFDSYLKAMRLPQEAGEQKKVREEAIQAGLREAIEVPLTTMRLATSCWEAMLEVAKYGNIASKSDVEVGAKALETGIYGASRNVWINIGGINDEAYKQAKTKEAEEMLANAQQKCKQVLEILAGRRE
jgi:glutamate formiminotransferase/formiminotetrahydrofolate cyclodeaminase